MIKLKNTPEQVELVKAIGSKKHEVSKAAMDAFAAAISPVIAQVLEQLGTASLIYQDHTFNEGESPSYPLGLFYGEDAGLITVWSQEIAGGLPTNEIHGSGEMKFSYYTLDSAVSFLKEYARKSNFNVLSLAISRMLQEVLVKQERMAWAPIMRALGEASTNVNKVATKHTIAATTQNVLQLDDFSRLLTLAKRINSSFAGGTAVTPYSKGVTDLFMSPEMKQEIRGFSYNPVNTRAFPNSDESTAVPLWDSLRENIYKNAGAEEIYGINLTELNELGTTQKYNVLFSAYATAGIAAGGGNFSATTDEVIVGADLSKGAFIRAVEVDGETGSTFVALNDDQFPVRSKKVGLFGSMQESRHVLDSRALLGLII